MVTSPCPSRCDERSSDRTAANGLLLVIDNEALTAATSAIEGLGLEIRMWGNGSPRSARGWAWSMVAEVWLLEFQRVWVYTDVAHLLGSGALRPGHCSRVSVHALGREVDLGPVVCRQIFCSGR